MIKRDIQVECKSGIVGEVATRLINKASRFISNIIIINGERKANAKSLLGVLSLEIHKGDIVIFDIQGKDEVEAIEEMIKCLG